MSDDKLQYLLRELKEKNAEILPTPFISTRLKAEAARVATRRKRRRYLRLLIPTFSVTFLLVMLLQWRNEIGSRLSIASTDSPTSSHKQSVNSTDRDQQPLASSTNYIAIPSSAALPAPIETTVVRVVLKKEKLRQLGFSVSEGNSSEPTKADFVLGEDGLARSIRFVGSIEGISVLKTAAMGSRS